MKKTFWVSFITFSCIYVLIAGMVVDYGYTVINISNSLLSITLGILIGIFLKNRDKHIFLLGFLSASLCLLVNLLIHILKSTLSIR